MNQIKIGKFIAESRKKQNLTQLQLAEKLGITDRAVSKWENGKTMPDSAIMLELCQILHITVNDLLNGELVSSDDYTRKLEERLLELADGKEQSDKMSMLLLSLLCGGLCVLRIFIRYLKFILLWDKSILIIGIIITMLIISTVFLGANVSYRAGYFRCNVCGHTHVPPYKKILKHTLLPFSLTPVFYCSNCDKHTKHKKVYKKE